jgi:hypothetical protein
MTIKTKHYIEISDVISLHFECLKCTSAFDIDIEKMEPPMVYECPICRSDWAVLRNPNTGAQIARVEPFKQLVKTLIELKGLLGKDSMVGFKMLLELNPSTVSREEGGKV